MQVPVLVGPTERRTFCVWHRALIAALFVVSCDHESPHHTSAPILLFEGTGTSPGDVAAFEALLDRAGLAYETASSAELDAMSASRLGAHRLLIVPGGDFVAMGNGLSESTHARIHDAVHGGVGYLGICAGAFLAGHFPAPYRAIDLTAGVQFHFYAAEERGIRRAAVPITTPSGPVLEQYWEDGPRLDGWGAVLGRYPDGTAAIAQGNVGRGWVILAGVHPEAPASWRGELDFATPAEDDNAYAITLVRAALDRTRLPSF
jgi:glutamine amidotransferase-like uncharacterized protein